MIPWIQVYSNLSHHPKTSRLADELKLTSAAVNPNVIAVGIMVSLWTWAIQNAYDGDLSRCGARAIADACAWKKKPQALVDALVAVGWLDDDMRLHDWEEYAVLLMDAEDNKREKTKERVQRYRDKKRNVTVTPQERYCNADVTPCNAQDSVTCNADVTVTQALRNADVTPLHNHTIQDHTIPDQVNISSYLSEEERKKEKKKESGQPTTRRSYGRFVRLTLADHAALLREFGTARLSRLIRAVDASEQAPATPEDDWPRVIRKAAEDGVGVEDED